jgi:hypothetical protein
VTADAATLVWLAPDPPTPSQKQGLAEWARAHGVVLVSPSDERPPALPVDPGAAERVEAMLDRARDGLAAHEGDAVDGELASAEALLRVHPELPQAAWLMAEIERARGTRFRTVDPIDSEAADRAWMRAQALDGGRVPGLNEEPAARIPRAATLAVETPPEDGLRVDGVERTGPVSLLEGLHAVVVTWNGLPVWATWVELPAGDSSLRPAAPGPLPCSLSDTRNAVGTANDLAAARVRCPRWVTATGGTRPGSLEVAECEAGRCGEPREWEPPAAWSRTPPAARAGAHPSWPAWATWALVGGGVAVAAGVAAVTAASGAFSSPSQESRFVTGGVARGP